MKDQITDTSVDSNEEQNAVTADARRQAVRKIVYGAGAVVGAQALPSAWVKPVVEAVILPAHAQTSLAAAPIVLGSNI